MSALRACLPVGFSPISSSHYPLCLGGQDPSQIFQAFAVLSLIDLPPACPQAPRQPLGETIIGFWECRAKHLGATALVHHDLFTSQRETVQRTYPNMVKTITPFFSRAQLYQIIVYGPTNKKPSIHRQSF